MALKRKRTKIINKFNSRCAYCGDPIHDEQRAKEGISRMQVDHVIPRHNFETCIKNNFNVPHFLVHLTLDDVNHVDNLFPCCIVCNRLKDTLFLEDFRRELGNQLERAYKYSTNYRIAKKYNQVKETPHEIVFYFETIENNGLGRQD